MGSDTNPTVADRPSGPRGDAVEPAAPGPRYTEGTEIARGGMGRVIEATDGVLGRSVAVKQVLSQDPELLRRFARETRITARLEHPSIVPVYDAGIAADGSPFYVMRKVTGRPLENLVRDAATLAQRLALVPHVLAAAQAVAHAHHRGVVHRDIKPTNILVGELGETVVIDWGLAKVIGEPDDDGVAVHASEMAGAGDSLRTRIGVVFGTPGFMPPEQLVGDPVDERGDVYSLGATLYHLLSQHSPHQASSGTAMMGAAMEGPPMPLDELVQGVPPELSTIVDTALARDRAVRYPDAGALAADLQRFLAGQLVASHHYTTRQRLVRFAKKHRVALAIGALAIVALVVGGAIAVGRVVEERDRADHQASLATARQRDAEAAGARESERADQLLLVQARTLVDTNPTAAVALLKQLRSPPERWDRLWRNARGIAAAARSSGVAVSYPGPDLPMQLRFSPDGRHATALGRDNSVWVYDLVRGESRHALTTPEVIASVEYLDDDRLVVNVFTDDTHNASGVFSTSRGVFVTPLTPVPSRPVAVAVTPHGILWNDDAGVVWRVSPDDLAATRVPLPVAIRSLWGSPDHAHIAYASDAAIGLLDPSTSTLRELAHETAAFVQWDRTNKRFAVSSPRGYAIVDIETASVRWLESKHPLMASLTKDTIAVIDTPSILRVGFQAQLEPRFSDPLDVSLGIHATNIGMAVATSGRRLVLVDGLSTMLVPAPVEGFTRLSASPNSSFIIAASAGRLYVWDLAQMFSRSLLRLPKANLFAMGDQRTLVMNELASWYWVDLGDRSFTKLSNVSPATMVHPTVDPAVMIGIDIAQAHNAYTFTRAGVTPIAANVSLCELTADGSILVGSVDGTIDSISPAGVRTRMIDHAGELESMAWESGSIVALYTDGTVIRRTAAGRVTTTKFALEPTRRLFLVYIDNHDEVLLPEGDHLVRWFPDGHRETVGTFPDVINSISYNRDLILATTRDHAGWVLDRSGKLTGRIPAGVSDPQVSAFGSFAAFLDAYRNIEIVDLVSGEIWPIAPRDRWATTTHIHVSTDAKLIGALDDTGLTFWRIDVPETAAATASWLDAITNATAEGGDTALAWPARATTANR